MIMGFIVRHKLGIVKKLELEDKWLGGYKA
jgi:hypothetical protein